jgi:hypothetical protein
MSGFPYNTIKRPDIVATDVSDYGPSWSGGMPHWERRAAKVNALVVGIHIGVTPTLDDIPVGHWAERKAVSNVILGVGTWIVLKAA